MSKFVIEKTNLEGIDEIKLINTHTNEFVGILPSMGGAVNELVIHQNGKLVPILDYYSSKADLDTTFYSSFKGSNLFPFPNRINKAGYTFNGKNYQLPLNSPSEIHAIHGLVYDKPFAIIKEGFDENHAYLKLEYKYKGEVEGYPFHYTLEIEYILRAGEGFTCNTIVINNSNGTIPVGSGWHPYFMAGDSINDVSLEFPCKSIYKVDDVMIPTGVTEPYAAFNSLKPIAETLFDTCFELSQNTDKANIKVENPKQGLAYNVWAELGSGKYNFLQIYIPPQRKSIALEPMTCAPDAFNNGFGTIELATGDSTSFAWGVSW